jgi:hypothetical protein
MDDERREGGDRLQREAEQSTEEHLDEDVAQDIDLDEEESVDDAGPTFDPARYLPHVGSTARWASRRSG